MRKIYVASSWRNADQPRIVRLLRGLGHEVYDFRNPAPDDDGFHWSHIDRDWQSWTLTNYIQRLTTHLLAADGYHKDIDALNWCDTCVLLLPCGRSAHLEAGYARGQGKRLIIYLSTDRFEPELMYLMGHGLVLTEQGLVQAIEATGPRLDEGSQLLPTLVRHPASVPPVHVQPVDRD